jgi:hypothetical protein
MITDPTLLRIGEVVQLSPQGEREAARHQLAEIWDEIGGERGDPLHRCRTTCATSWSGTNERWRLPT